tara:strand:- start:1198 stop:2079 length:882 start_codon:yes stop_codon:yes gene_type:complete
MSVKKLIVNSDNENRRLDNFLFSKFKNIPKSKLYNIIRKGELRVNSARKKPSYKLSIDDEIRIPPNIYSNDKSKKLISDEHKAFIKKKILFENKNYIIINKPNNLSVHGGSKINFGVINIIKDSYSDEYDLCHRLDKETSGCLVIGKNKKAVKNFQNQISNKKIKKIYYAILKGHLNKTLEVDKPIIENKKEKTAFSRFSVIKKLNKTSLVKIEISTGRTHQIRIHAHKVGFPILFDKKYGDKEFNNLISKSIKKSKIALHAKSIKFEDIDKSKISVTASNSDNLEYILKELS